MRIINLSGLFVLSTILAASPVITAASSARVDVAVSIRIGPPVLPVYAQPICPERGYIWVPGYWAYGDDGYYWVPGMWVRPPRVGFLWTPGYWAFNDGFYLWHAGYWGANVGFYGGIDYGFGYPGTGFYGAYWRGGDYFYNTRVTNVNTTIIQNVYNDPVVNEHGVSRVSYNGGPHGIQARPTTAELSAARASHVAMTGEQLQHQQSARSNRTMLASVNHGRPDVAATSRPELNGRREGRSEKPATEHNNAKGVSERHSNSSPAHSHSVAPTHPATPAHNAAPTHNVAPTEKPHSSKPASSHSVAPAPSHTTRHDSAPSKPAVSHNERPAANRPSSPAPSHSVTTEHAQPSRPSSHSTVTEHSRPAKTENAQPHPAPSHSQASHTEQQPKPQHTQQSHASASRPAPAHSTESQKPEHNPKER